MTKLIQKLRNNVNKAAECYGNGLYHGLGDIFVTQVDKKGLVGIIAGAVIAVTAMGDTAYAGGVLLEKFNQIEKEYIAAHKTDKLEDEVRKTAELLAAKTEMDITVEKLLDGNNQNYEFKGIGIDETDDFNPITVLVYKTPDGKLDMCHYGGFTTSNKFFITEEINNMRDNIKQGTLKAENYSKMDGKKERFTRTLDAQAGKIKGVTLEMTPRFEHQMIFRTEKEMRDTLDRTARITIEYKPHDTWSLGTGTDYKVTYELNDGTKAVKYTSDFPLDFVLR